MPSRMISPDFWTDTAMIQLPMPVRLFYIGTWNFACSAGHLPDDALQIKLKVLPADPVDGTEFIETLVQAGRLERITLSDGARFLRIPSFARHQKQDARYQSRCPACRDSPNPAETPASSGEFPKTRQLSVEGGGGKGGEEGNKGEGESRVNALTPPSRYCPDHPNGFRGKCGPCGDARREFDAWKTEQANKPTPTPQRESECEKHPHYPLPCDKCAAIAAEGDTQ